MTRHNAKAGRRGCARGREAVTEDTAGIAIRYDYTVRADNAGGEVLVEAQASAV